MSTETPTTLRARAADLLERFHGQHETRDAFRYSMGLPSRHDERRELLARADRLELDSIIAAAKDGLAGLKSDTPSVAVLLLEEATGIAYEQIVALCRGWGERLAEAGLTFDATACVLRPEGSAIVWAPRGCEVVAPDYEPEGPQLWDERLM